MENRAKAILVFLLFIGAVVSSYFALETYIEAKLVEKFSKRIKELPFNVSCAEIDYSLLKNTITLKDINTNILGMNISVKAVEIDLPFTARKKELPDRMLIKVIGLEFPSSLIGITNTPRTIVNLVTGYSFEDDSLQVMLKTSVSSLGDLSLLCKLKNLSKRKLERALAGVISERRTIRETKIEYLALKYKDRGFVHEYFKQQALEEGISVEELKKKLITSINESINKDKVLMERIGQPLIEFIENPHCIELIAYPVLPISLKELSLLLNGHPDLRKTAVWLGIKFKVCK
ncbi:hypothetical protein [Phorcysia thermohydrogeniphila]|uniref:Uncharacterized protein n=1 Tax=Phorcysia thermohydrogeniphila TaxID=936138 RepID=A0A4R1GAT4_9BACT|nr:hypothetical protein [Phorcysia thermohydrogeniphila]TCK05337.1 hypothetical protein CLV27_0764 [Phorcysia thermohydrogeniphila]